ncbi:MAG: hypothetical protein M9899_05035 [Bdellovibrionaceae bacterium]|nr:hypothetical protein [Pseudobdellovibrionaceae bacterium]
MSDRNKKVIAFTLGLLAIGFGVMTIKSGGFALFGGVEGKDFAGRYVPFVLWFNFIAGFFYVISGIGIILKTKWALKSSIILAALTLLVFLAFGIHIFLGNPYETRTIGAMSIRTIFWIFISVSLMKIGSNNKQEISL